MSLALVQELMEVRERLQHATAQLVIAEEALTARYDRGFRNGQRVALELAARTVEQGGHSALAREIRELKDKQPKRLQAFTIEHITRAMGYADQNSPDEDHPQPRWRRKFGLFMLEGQ